MSENDAERHEAFPRLDHADIAALTAIAVRRRLRDGEPLFEAGQRRGGVFVVLTGAVAIIDRSGDEARAVAVHQPGEFTRISTF